MTEQTIKKMMETIDACKKAMMDFGDDKNMILAMTFTILDMAAGFVGVPTTEVLKEYLPLIEEVNNIFGAVTFEPERSV